MGRYSSVQNFADGAAAASAVPYDKATGGLRTDPDAKGQTVRVEAVRNVTGSTAGAGSGLFHIYRHERRRENERLKRMDDEFAAISAEQEFRAHLEGLRADNEEKTRKRADKRRKRKERRKRRRDDPSMPAAADGDGEDAADSDVDSEDGDDLLASYMAAASGVQRDVCDAPADGVEPPDGAKPVVAQAAPSAAEESSTAEPAAAAESSAAASAPSGLVHAQVVAGESHTSEAVVPAPA